MNSARTRVPLNAFTVDLEDWFQGLEMGPEEWGRFESRIRIGTERLLALLQRAGVRATFFVLGQVAESAADLVREIQSAGHEIGTHGWNHRFVYRLGAPRFADDLRRSVELLQSLVGAQIAGHRAPFFSITRESPWAWEILHAQGIRYDSSVFPVRNYRYGMPEAPRHVYRAAADVVEFPISTWRLPGFNLPVAGGAYFRILPYSFIRMGLRRINSAGNPAVFYIHPWELDPEQPRLALPRRIALTHYWNLRATAPRLERLLRDFSFAPMGEVLENLGWLEPVERRH